MKEVRSAVAWLAVVLLLVSMLGGASAPTADADGYIGLTHVASVPGIDRGAGVWVDGDTAYVTGYDSDRLHVVDVADPTAPTRVGDVDLFGRDVNVVHHPDGHDYAVVASESRLAVVDVTDPAQPTVVGDHDVGTHNVVDLPGTTLVYPANSAGDDTPNPIVDIQDPTSPRTVASFGDTGCHDIEFNLQHDRLYCAGVGRTEIWDISTPTDPELVSQITNPLISAPGAVHQKPNFLGVFGDIGPGVHHWATDARGGDLLVLGDEFAGALGPGCGAHAEAGPVSASDPLGALWFYDISDPTDPRLQGWYSPTVPADDQLFDGWTYPSCTSHFGEVIDGTDQLVTGWYRAGTVLVDFSDPANPTQAGQWRGDAVTWDARLTGDGYVVTGDLARGADVLRLER